MSGGKVIVKKLFCDCQLLGKKVGSKTKNSFSEANETTEVLPKIAEVNSINHEIGKLSNKTLILIWKT